MKKFLSEAKRIITKFCDHPEHLQRWAIIGSGLAVGAALLGIISLLVYFGLHVTPAGALVIPILGNIGYGFVGLFGLVVIALLGIVRGIKAMLPNGTSIEVDLVDKRDHDNEASR